MAAFAEPFWVQTHDYQPQVNLAESCHGCPPSAALPSPLPSVRGHGSIALGHWAVDTGRVIKLPDAGSGVVDVPSGRVLVSVTVTDGIAQHADFVNVGSYQLART